MVFQIFDMERLDPQHEFYQAFDFVIATNAIHATCDILNYQWLNGMSSLMVDICY